MRRLEVLVVGAGISGVGVAIKLLEQRVTDFLVLEKAAQPGGTWRDITYPGCACDIPSALYSYSFAQKHDWSRVFAGQREILDYVKQTAERFQVMPYLQFDTEVIAAAWKGEHWQVQTTRGDFEAKKLISCTGSLHEPIIPKLPGLRDFQGPVFHSARWNHSVDLRGRKVAVIGTGASAIQFVPEIQPLAEHLAIFQRSPRWILPRPDFATPPAQRGLFTVPGALTAFRQLLSASLEALGAGYRNPKLLEAVEQVGRAHLRSAIRDEALRKKLTPDDTPGCKRLLISNHYYPSLQHPNVELFATGVREIRGNVVVGSDGTERAVDVVILATGFHVSAPPIAERVRGSSGQSLAEVWKGSPQAYRGTTVAGFPNFFLMLGPNLGIGLNSAFLVIEAQLEYVMGALRAMERHALEVIDVKRQVQAAYNEDVQRDLRTTVWNVGGCSSDSLDVNGRNCVGFPWSTREMKRLLNDFDLESYGFK